MSTSAKPAWAGQHLRLDPARLPQCVSYASLHDSSDVTFTIDNRGVVVRRTLENSGLPISMVLPVTVFEGVAARAIEDDNGDVTVTLELHHPDQALSVPLLVADDLNDIAADWRAWSKAYGLPMLLVESDGVARPLEDTIGKVKRSAPVERRKGKVTNHFRPRFLARRQSGNGLGLRVIVNGDELIARN